MTLSDITFESRNDLLNYLQSNKHTLVLKFGAEWCTPCKIIAPLVDECIESTSESIKCVILDIDDCFDLYAFLKSKKIVTSIPTIVAYKSGNTSYVPDDVVIGTDPENIQMFFDRLE